MLEFASNLFEKDVIAIRLLPPIEKLEIAHKDVPHGQTPFAVEEAIAKTIRLNLEANVSLAPKPNDQGVASDHAHATSGLLPNDACT